jgi:glyoxylase-like metal-dependent hydrolase (beta-lactamase superfamily II)
MLVKEGIFMETRVISRKEPIEPKSWAWVVQLRENEKLKKVYKIHPYAEVYCLKEGIYSIYTESADGMGDPWAHLIIGPERAMLIDTSFGIGNLKGLVDKLTGKMPLIVANTHHHIDHSYGNCQFDRVYCHEYSVPYLEQQRNPHAWDHLYDKNGKGIWLEFDKKEIIPFKEYEIISCPNNYIFDLGGGHEVELIFMPGHAPGGCCYLDKKNRILFSGDTLLTMRVGVGGPIAGMPYGEFCKVTAFRNELAKLAPRSDEFDSVFPGHHILGLDKSIVQDMLDACNAVIADPDCYDYTEVNTRGIECKMKKVKGFCSLAYTNSSI